MRAACYARVSTSDQKTLSAQITAMKSYARKRKWQLVSVVEEVGSGRAHRQKRQDLISAAIRREIDAIIVWKLDRWGRSIVDLVSSLQTLTEVGVGFVSITEALDFTTPSGRAFAGMLSVFAEFERDLLSERIRAGIAEARKKGRPHGRPLTAGMHADKVKTLHKRGVSQSEIARRLQIGRTSVKRLIDA
ncbi:MAG: recombinase family protein [Deltaproteobacteria bacterium]|nr:recombinase family protein [Deltaproteobacteria bacterium]